MFINSFSHPPGAGDRLLREGDLSPRDLEPQGQHGVDQHGAGADH